MYNMATRIKRLVTEGLPLRHDPEISHRSQNPFRLLNIVSGYSYQVIYNQVLFFMEGSPIGLFNEAI